MTKKETNLRRQVEPDVNDEMAPREDKKLIIEKLPKEYLITEFNPIKDFRELELPPIKNEYDLDLRGLMPHLSGRPQMRTLMPTVGEPLRSETFFEDWGGHEHAFPKKPELKPFAITPGHLSAILNALATHGEGEQEIEEAAEEVGETQSS
ncbi:MAG TPA: hypothetical protein PKH60_03735 [Candidatus Woesebacteria bacterium]|nr:hypothetical protein [Candidatus Woesebacteria bacterium]